MKEINHTRRLQFYLWLGSVWLFLWIFFRGIISPEKFVQLSLNEIWRVIYIVFVNYIFFEYSVPLIIRKRSSIVFGFLIGVLLVTIQFLLISFGFYSWISLGMELNIYTQFRFSTLIPDGLYYRMIDTAFFEARAGIASVVYFGIVKLVHHNFRLKQSAQQLRLEKQEAELNYLKSQTNPHFLFNTLNNIYSLAKDKSDQTPESILQLSRILRFMLYDTKEKFICIEQELELIRNYIALEKLRYDDSMKLSFRYEIEDMKQTLPPLLMIPLIENAFKHGVSETSDQSFVDIYLSIGHQRLKLVVKNSSENVEGKIMIENIGLSNLRCQLELLYMDYNLTVDQGDKEFVATLTINLLSHV